MYDAVAAVEGGLKPFATGVTAPPGASADAAVAQAARDVLVERVPAADGSGRPGLQPVHVRDPGRPRQGEWEGGGCNGCGRHAHPAHGRWVRRQRSLRPADTGAWRVRANRSEHARQCRAALRAPVHVRDARVSAGPTVRTDEQALRGGRGGAEGARREREHGLVSDARADRNRPLPWRTDVHPVQRRPTRARQRA